MFTYYESIQKHKQMQMASFQLPIYPLYLMMAFFTLLQMEYMQHTASQQLLAERTRLNLSN